MKHFMFNDSGQQGRHSLPALTHAGIRPLFFVSIHPFEYENGRIGQAIAEKPLSQCLGYPTLIATGANDQHPPEVLL